MAVPVAVGDVYELETWCRCRGQYAMNKRTLLFDFSTGVAGITDQDLVENFALVLADAHLAAMCNDAFFYGCSLIRTHPSAAGPVTSTLDLPGVFAGFTMALQVAALIRMNTGRVGRRNKGRTYLPFVPNGFMGSNGQLTSLATVRYNTLRHFASAGISLDIAGQAHHFQPIVRNSSTAFGRAYTQSSLSPDLATMRSRSRIYGPDTAPF